MDWKKYVLTFFITAAVFGGAFWASGMVYDRQLGEMRAIADNVSVNLASSDIQYNLLFETSCDNADAVGSSSELDQYASRLAALEAQRGADDTEVISMKKQYALLAIKDFILGKRVGERCGNPPAYVLYFYGGSKDCPECDKQSLVLTRLKQNYPGVRVYAFDYNLDLGAMKSFRTMYRLNGKLPALVIAGRTHYGFKDEEAILKIAPRFKQFAPPEDKATSTEK